jgi:hypothetical protein
VSTTTKTLLTFDDAVSRVEEAAKGREDFVYDRKVPVLHPETDEPELDDEGEPVTDSACVYLEDDQTPSCIVGCAFALDIVEVGITPGSTANEDGVGSLFREDNLLGSRYAVTRRAAVFLQAVQAEQDNKTPWGEAISKAKTKAHAELDDVEAYTGLFW